MTKETIKSQCVELSKAIGDEGGVLYAARVPELIYRKHEGISQSDVKTVVEKSPYHYQVSRRYGMDKETPALVLGKLTHTLLFEPVLFKTEYAVMPEINRRTKAGKAEYEAFLEENKGRLIVSDDQCHTARRMVEAAKQNTIVKQEIRGGYFERCFFAPMPDRYGSIPVPRKARLDFWNEHGNTIVDYKTTESARKDAFIRSVLKYGYHYQDAWYSDLVKDITGSMPRFIFIVQEKTAPYATAVYELEDEFKEFGRSRYTEGLRELSHCFKHDYWPGYPEEIQKLNIPNWTKRQWDDSLLEALD